MKRFIYLMLASFMLGLVTLGGYHLYQLSSSHSKGGLLMANVEALTQSENQTYRYPHRAGLAEECTLFVYFKGGVKVGWGAVPLKELEGSGEYLRVEQTGLKDLCQIDKEEGCNPFSCQEGPY